MDFRQTTSEAAHVAAKSISSVMRSYARKHYHDEDDLNPAVAERLRADLDGKIGGLTFESTIFRHRSGIAGEESSIGADIAIFFNLNTPTHKFQKGLLIQAKRIEPEQKMSQADLDRLHEQCEKMLKITPASFVFNYARHGMRCASASKIAGCKNRELYSECDWTPYRFFLEFFRCPIGDRRFSSSLYRHLPVPHALEISAKGEFFHERYAV